MSCWCPATTLRKNEDNNNPDEVQKIAIYNNKNVNTKRKSHLIFAQSHLYGLLWDFVPFVRLTYQFSFAVEAHNNN